MNSVFGTRRPNNRTNEWLTAKGTLRIMAIVLMFGAGIYWHEIVKIVTPHAFSQWGLTILLTIAPPALSSFIFPFSPAGMLLQKIQSKTIGYAVVIICTIILVYYQYVLSMNWWATQPVVAESGYVGMQVMIGFVGFLAVPALAWPSTTDAETVESVRQQQLIQRYEEYTKYDIRILRQSVMRARDLSEIGFSNLSDTERREMSSIMRGLTKGIEHTIGEIAESVGVVSGAKIPVGKTKLEVSQYLDYVAEALGLDEGTAGPSQAQSNNKQRASNGKSVMNNAQQSYGSRNQPALEDVDEEDNYSSGSSYTNRKR